MRNNKAANFLVGSAIGLLFLAPIMWERGVFDPVPYRDVDVLSVEQGDGYVDISFSFVKVGCVVDSAVALGERLGFLNILSFDSSQGGDAADRLAGSQVVNLRVLTGDIAFDAIEIRTRHICGGQVDYNADGEVSIRGGKAVDRVLLKVKL